MGVMGAGLARQIRTVYPSVYERYREFSLSRSPKELMGFSLWTSLDKGGQLPFIVNCFAQEGFYKEGPQTDYDALMKCFVDISNICHESYGDCTIAIPDHIGCGLAGGDWNIVYQMIKDAFADYPGDVQIWKLP